MDMCGTITVAPAELLGAVDRDWAVRYRDAIADAGIVANLFTSGDELAQALAGNWEAAAVIVDLGLVTPALCQRLTPDGPRVLAFGNPDHAGAALAANLADFIPDAPTPAELLAAVGSALTPSLSPVVADLSDCAIVRLGALGSDANRIAAALARLDAAQPGTAPPIDLDRLRAVAKARRARERFFPADIFGEPGWDMLLDLAIAGVERRDVAVSSLCIAAAVPTTTALRWIRNLCNAGLFERRNDPADARRAFISLSEPAMAAMARYLGATKTAPWC